MRSRYRILEPDAAHFVTGTIVEWLPVFTSDGCCEVLVQSLLHCRQHRALEIHAWGDPRQSLSRHPLRPGARGDASRP